MIPPMSLPEASLWAVELAAEDERDASRLHSLVAALYGCAEADRVVPLARAGLIGTPREAYDRIADGWLVDLRGRWLPVPHLREIDPRSLFAVFEREEIAAMNEDTPQKPTAAEIAAAQRSPDPTDRTPASPRKVGHGRAKPAGRDRNRVAKARVLAGR